MSTPAEREKMLAEMAGAEKPKQLRWSVRDLAESPGIESTPDVMAVYLALTAPGYPYGCWNKRAGSERVKQISFETIPHSPFKTLRMRGITSVPTVQR
jgi:hypothetical protein